MPLKICILCLYYWLFLSRLAAIFLHCGVLRSAFCVLRAADKHADVRMTLSDICHENYRCYGYGRLHAMLCHEGARFSEKAVRSLMTVVKLVVS